MTSGGALLVALLSQSPIGAPETAPRAVATTVRLDVRAAPECTSRNDLTARVAARSPRIQFADDAAVSARVAVTSARPGEVIAELVFATAGAEQPPRRFVARSCMEAADAVALIVAVTLDPTLARKPTKGSAPGAAPDTAGDAAAPTATDPGGAASPPPPRPADQPAEARPPPPPAAELAAPAQARSPATLQLGASLAGQTIYGPAPAVMPGVALYAMAALDRDGPWAPALFVGATHVWRADLATPGGAASFTLDAASLDACPLRLRWSLFAARPCASALVGRMTTSGTDIPQAASFQRPFAVTGVALVAGFGTTIELSLRLAIGVTLLRDSYEIGTTIFHRAGAVTTSASLGIGVRWP
jgi:hypothetical protein